MGVAVVVMGLIIGVTDDVSVIVAEGGGVNTGVIVFVGVHIVNEALDTAPWLSMAVFKTVPEFDVTIPTHDTTPPCPAPRDGKVQFMTPPILFPLPLIAATFICAGIVSHTV